MPTDPLATPTIERASRVTFGAGLGGDPQPPVTGSSGGGRGRPPGPRTLRARSKAVRDLTIDVECSHLLGSDLPVIMQPDWLPRSGFFALGDRVSEHHRLLAEVEKANAAVRLLREELKLERQRRTAQIAQGTAEGRPRPDGVRLIAESEELAVAAVARLYRFADETLKQIAEQAPEWEKQLAERDSEAQQALAEARAALTAAQERAGETAASRAWLDASQERTQVLSWANASQMQVAPPVDPAQAEHARRVAGWS